MAHGPLGCFSATPFTTVIVGFLCQLGWFGLQVRQYPHYSNTQCSEKVVFCPNDCRRGCRLQARWWHPHWRLWGPWCFPCLSSVFAFAHSLPSCVAWWLQGFQVPRRKDKNEQRRKEYPLLHLFNLGFFLFFVFWFFFGCVGSSFLCESFP